LHFGENQWKLLLTNWSLTQCWGWVFDFVNNHQFWVFICFRTREPTAPFFRKT
jgi:hypothetical protein